MGGKGRQWERRDGTGRDGKGQEGKARQGKARQGKARQSKARQSKAKQGKAGWVYNMSPAKKNTALSKLQKCYLTSFVLVQKMPQRQRQGTASILRAARKN